MSIRKQSARKPWVPPSNGYFGTEALERRLLLSAQAIINYVGSSSTRDHTGTPSPLVLAPSLPTYVVANPSLVGSTTPVGFQPAGLRRAYGLNSVPLDGNGETIAIVDAYDDPQIRNDPAQFDGYFGLPSPPSFAIVSQTGGSSLPVVDPSGPGSATSWEREEALDVEWAHAIAPAASLLLVEANSNAAVDLYTAVNYARLQSAVSVISMSFAAPESQLLETQYDSVFNTTTGHQGVTFVASSGDWGAYNSRTLTQIGVTYPSACPHVLSVGGTSLALDPLSNYSSEVAWTDSGGGLSSESQPAYQAGVFASAYRAVPDVSFDADPNTGVAVYDSYDYQTNSAWAMLGGTSASAPCWAGIISLADQRRSLVGLPSLDGPTQVLPTLYTMNSQDFHDITSGGNSVYQARVGYDLATGRGTPVSPSLIRDLSGVLNLPPSTPFNVSPADGSIGVSSTPTLSSSGFSDPDYGDAEHAAQWQVIRPSDSVVVWDSNVDTMHLTSVTVPASTQLGYGTKYLWRVRYQDNHAAWSGYSVETSFTTMVLQPKVVVQFAGAIIQNNQPTAIDFGSVNQGQAPVSLSFTVQNTGQAALTLGTVSVPAGYTVVAGLGSPVAPGGSEQFAVELETDSGGTKAGNISFSSNDPNNATFSFPITGVVVPPTFYSVYTTPAPVAGGTATGAGSYREGLFVTVTASPNPGFGFLDWTESGSDVSDSASYGFIVAGNRNLIANFVPIGGNLVTIAGALIAPSEPIVDGGEVYFAQRLATDGAISEVSAAGGPVSTVTTGLSLVDSGALRTVNPYTLVGSTLYGGYGDYTTTNIFSAPVAGGPSSTLTTISGGSFIGVIGNAIYYSTNYNGVNAMPLSGGTVTTFAAGNWVRSSAVDSGSIYFVEYYSKDVRKLDVSTGAITTLITGNTSEGSVLVDGSHVFLNIAGNIEEVSKSGGTVTTLVSTGTATAYCSDGSYVYFIDGTSLERVPAAGGSPSVLTTILANAISGVAVDANNIYWIDSSAAAIRRLSLPGSSAGFITGSVFSDANHNGIEDGGESMIKGVTVYIDANNNGVYDPGEPTAQADISGTYTFPNLAPGTYRVREVVPSGSAETAPIGYGQAVQLAPGQTAQGPVFGNVAISSVTMNLSYFLTVTRNFGQPGTFATGDLNGDGTVNLADLLLLTRNFGHALPASASVSAIATAPGQPVRSAARRGR